MEFVKNNGQRSPETIRLEDIMSSRLMKWALDHQSDPSAKGLISVVDFDPQTYPDQAIDQPVAKVSLREGLPSEAIFNELDKSLRVAAPYNSPESIDELLQSFESSREERFALLKQGKNIATIFGHQNLSDIGIGTGAKAINTGSEEYIRKRCVTVYSKTITLESFMGTRIVDHTTPYSNLVFVLPDNDKTRITYGIPKEVSKNINQGGYRALFEFMKAGADVSLVLAGSKISTEGQIPEAQIGAASLLSRFDKYQRASMWQNEQGVWRFKVSPLLDVQKPDHHSLSKEERVAYSKDFADKVQRELALDLSELSGKEITYRPDVVAQYVGRLATSPSQ